MDFIFAIVMVMVGLIASDRFYANQEQQQLAQDEVKDNKVKDNKVKDNKVKDNKVVNIKDKLANRRKAPHLYS